MRVEAAPALAPATTAVRDLLHVAALFAALSVVYLAAVRLVTGGTGFPLDDAYIHLQFARNFYERGEMSFNPGIPSSGSTAPAFAVLLAAAYALIGDWTAASHAVCALAGLAGCWLVYAIVRGWTGEAAHARAAALLTCIAAPTVMLSFSGMEATSYVMLFLVGLWLYGRGSARSRLGGVACFALCIWLRPEMGAMLPIALLEQVLRWRAAPREARRPVAREMAGTIAIFAVVLAAYAAYHRQQDGHWVPTTFAAKAIAPFALRPAWLDGAVSALRHGRWGQAALAALVLSPLNLVLVGVGLAWICAPLAFGGRAAATVLWRAGDGAGPAKRLAILTIVGYPLLRSLVEPGGVIWYQMQRYFAHLTPLLIIVVFCAWPATRSLAAHRRWRWDGLPPRVQYRRTMGWACASAMVMAAWSILAAGNVADMQVAAAHWLRENSAADDLVATNDIGAIGFLARRPVLDTVGLVEPRIVEHMLAGGTMMEYLEQRRPRYLIIFPDWYPGLVEATGLEPVHRFAVGFNVICGGCELVVYRPPWNDEPPQPAVQAAGWTVEGPGD